MKRGRAATMTPDYKRNGTTTLFAVLDMLDGTVVGECMPRRRPQEFLRFLRRLEREFPTTVDLHLIVDHYGTHKHPNVRTGWACIRASTSTSPPPRRPGSTSSSAGSAH
jgi:DDE superfamily endonuclease